MCLRYSSDVAECETEAFVFLSLGRINRFQLFQTGVIIIRKERAVAVLNVSEIFELRDCSESVCRSGISDCEYQISRGSTARTPFEVMIRFERFPGFVVNSHKSTIKIVARECKIIWIPPKYAISSSGSNTRRTSV